MTRKKTWKASGSRPPERKGTEEKNPGVSVVKKQHAAANITADTSSTKTVTDPMPLINSEEANWLKFPFWKKIALLAGIIIALTIIWFSGFEVTYARTLVGVSNFSLGLAGRESTIEVTEQQGDYFFLVTTIIEGRRGSYPQTFGALLLPAVMVMAWQLFMAFFLKRKSWLRSTLINMGIFMAVQALFLLLLTAYYTSDTARYLYDMMMDSFYIVALAIILVDNIRYPVFLIMLQKS